VSDGSEMAVRAASKLIARFPSTTSKFSRGAKETKFVVLVTSSPPFLMCFSPESGVKSVTPPVMLMVKFSRTPSVLIICCASAASSSLVLTSTVRSKSPPTEGTEKLARNVCAVFQLEPTTKKSLPTVPRLGKESDVGLLFPNTSSDPPTSVSDGSEMAVRAALSCT